MRMFIDEAEQILPSRKAHANWWHAGIRAITVGATVVLGVTTAMQAGAQTSCPTPTLSEIHAKGVFEAALLRARALGRERGEFETTDKYRTRMKEVISSLAPKGNLTFPWKISKYGFAFDADSGVVTYGPSSLDSGCDVNFSSGEYSRGKPFCIQQVIKAVNDKPKVMTNAFGAKVLVQPIHDVSIGIGLGLEGFPQDGPLGYHSASIFKFSASSSEAQSIKKNAVMVITMTPLPPLFVKGHHYSAPTIDDPQEWYGENYLLVGDISCISIADYLTGKVYQTIEVGPLYGMPDSDVRKAGAEGGSQEKLYEAR